MKCRESKVRMAPPFMIIAAIAFLLAMIILTKEMSGLESQRLQTDLFGAAPDELLVRRSTDNVRETPSLRPIPVRGQRMLLEDAYYLYRMDSGTNDPARLDGILMDNPRLFASLCRTV